MDIDQLREQLATSWEAGDADACLTLLDTLESLEPEQAGWPYDRGVLLQALGDVDGAMVQYRRAIELDPTQPHGWTNLGRLLDDVQRWPEALACYDHALGLPDADADPIPWTNRANTLLSLERFEDALADFERAVALEPGGESSRGRTTALGWLGRIAEANASRPLGTPYDRGELVEHTVPYGEGRLLLRYWVGEHSVPELLDHMAVHVLDQVAGLEDLTDGRWIGTGWSSLLVRERDGDFVLCEPDFAAAPFDEIVWDTFFTLHVALMQQRVLAMVGTPPSACTMHEAVVFAPGTLESPHLQLRRLHASDPATGASGWVVGPVDPDAFDAAVRGDLQALPSGHLARFRPSLIQVLTLPPGFVVVVRDDQVVQILDEQGDDRMLRP